MTPPSPEGEGLDRAHRPVILAAITGAHGLGGEVRLKLFGEGAEALKRYGRFNDGALTLASIKPDKGGAIARFAEIPDRAAAERARGTALSVPRSALPPLGKGEYYHHDLIGLPATSTIGEALGTVVRIENFGAGDVLEIERPDGKCFMVPMTRDAVPEWSVDAVVIDAGWIV
ncbi:MAG: ribosome maturation factor RimM [Sphingopyxis sp.]